MNRIMGTPYRKDDQKVTVRKYQNCFEKEVQGSGRLKQDPSFVPIIRKGFS